MGTNFSLLQQLEKNKHSSTKTSPFPKGVEYQEYVLEVEGQDQTIFIPLKETIAFETALSLQTKYISTDDLREILRTHRGIKV